MWKQHQVVMLATKSENFLNSERKHLIVESGQLFNPFKNQVYKPYVLSNEEIKEDDLPCHVYHKGTNSLQFIDTVSVLKEANEECKRIIATNDYSISPACDGKCARSECVCLYPNLPQSSLQWFADKYNDSGKAINYVEVEYEFGTMEESFFGEDGRERVPVKLVVNNDNTINIKLIKNSWSREEVETLIIDAVAQSHDWSKENNDVHSIGIIQGRFLNKWIEQNL